MPSPEESIHDAIAREEARLARLKEEIAETHTLLESLRAQTATRLPSLPAPVLPVGLTSVPATSTEKVALFRSRFRGREDLYPRFWSNARTGRKGYAPACANEWVRGVCEKPRVKCSECPNQAFLPVEDQVILDHLQGRHVVGVYPLLTDETCWFVAADFDKTSWTDDVGAFVETCRAAGLLAAVERSRSGNGAHVWFFFSAPVAASTARKMGCYLITETMSRRHQLSMESYDRLFPNQDTLPRGGFGNLIALPLQHGPRQMGNTVFVDDQWLEVVPPSGSSSAYRPGAVGGSTGNGAPRPMLEAWLHGSRAHGSGVQPTGPRVRRRPTVSALSGPQPIRPPVARGVFPHWRLEPYLEQPEYLPVANAARQ